MPAFGCGLLRNQFGQRNFDNNNKSLKPTN